MQGSTFIEALIAVALLTIAVLGGLAAITLAEGRLSVARGSSAALQLGESVLADLEARPFHVRYASLGAAGDDRSVRVDSRFDRSARDWAGRARDLLPGSWIVVELEGIGRRGNSFERASAVRARVVVSWPSGSQRRSVQRWRVWY